MIRKFISLIYSVAWLVDNLKKRNRLPLALIFSRANINLGVWNTLGSGCWMDGDVSIGDYCAIGPNVSFIATDHCFSKEFLNHRYLKSLGIKDDIIYGKICVGSNVFIGRNAIILSNIKIGDHAVIGAGSVVTKDVEPGAVVGGVPARVIKYKNV